MDLNEFDPDGMWDLPPTTEKFWREYKEAFKKDIKQFGDQMLDMVLDGLDNFVPYCIATAIVGGGLWLAVSNSQ